ncbi:MAG: hypothetical protein ACK56F_12320, partial [bacterium]
PASVPNTPFSPCVYPFQVCAKSQREAHVALSALSLHGACRTVAPVRGFKALQIVGSKLPRPL